MKRRLYDDAGYSVKMHDGHDEPDVELDMIDACGDRALFFFTPAKAIQLAEDLLKTTREVVLLQAARVAAKAKS